MGVKNIKEKLVTSFMDSPWWVLFFSLLFLEFLEIWETLKRLWNGRNPIFIIHIKTAKDEKEKRKSELSRLPEVFFFCCFKIQIHMYCLFMYKIVKSSQQPVIVKLVKSVRMCCLSQFIYFSNSNGNNIYFFDNKIGIFILLSHLVD